MKRFLIAATAAVLLAGCGSAQNSGQAPSSCLDALRYADQLMHEAGNMGTASSEFLQGLQDNDLSKMDAANDLMTTVNANIKELRPKYDKASSECRAD